MFGLGRPLPEGQWLMRDRERFWLPWVRHARARRLKLQIGSRGPRLTLPSRISEQAARDFVAKHSDWLWQQWQRHVGSQQPAIEIGETLALPWFGQRLPVDWQLDGALQVLRKDTQWCIHTAAGSNDRHMRAALLHAYCHEGRAWFLQRTQHYLPTLPKPPARLRVKRLRSVWGSLSASDRISLDVALLFAPPEVAEYVLVHELCHLLQRNHSIKFWHEVEMRCPDWRAQRDFLRKCGPGIKAEAQRVFA